MNTRGLIQSALGRKGYMLTRRPLEGSLERELLRLLIDRQIDTVVDVGAHEGRYGETLRNLGFAGRVVSFEPADAARSRLLDRVDAGWEAHDVALGDTDEEADFFEYEKHDELASLHAPSELGRRWGTDRARRRRVRVRRLDDVAEELNLGPTRALLKIDTQGHDLSVLVGGQRFAREAAGLQIEVPMFGQYEEAPTWHQLLNHALDLGFHLLGLFPVHAHPRPIVPLEFDALFIRRPL